MKLTGLSIVTKEVPNFLIT